MRQTDVPVGELQQFFEQERHVEGIAPAIHQYADRAAQLSAIRHPADIVSNIAVERVGLDANSVDDELRIPATARRFPAAVFDGLHAAPELQRIGSGPRRIHVDRAGRHRRNCR
ncbi:MAG: hypothetical protein ABIQ30_13430 [Devosia sp.]